MNLLIMIIGAALAALQALILSHIAGALWHKVILRDGVLESMMGRLPI